MKVLVFATDMLPVAGLPTSGTALRTYGLVQGLRAQGHEVIVSVPADAIAGFTKANDLSSLPNSTRHTIEQFNNLAFDSFNQGEILQEVDPDLILCGHWPALTLRSKPRQPIVVDLAGPHLLERHYQGSPDQQHAILGKLGVIATADYYIVSGPTQRLYFLAFMMRAGVPRPETRIATITMPLNPSLPERAAHTGDPRFVFGGVFLPWQDPSRGLDSLAQYIAERNRGTLKLIGGPHPNYPINEGKYRELFERLKARDFVQALPMLPFEQFTAELSSADVALDLMAWNLERELAMTIRSTTYLWAGLPVIYNDYADLGRVITSYDAGWQVDPADKNALVKVLDEIYDDPECVRRKSHNAQRLARQIFSWDRAVEPLLQLIGTAGTVSSNHTDILVDYPENAELTISRGRVLRQYFVCRLSGLNKVECRIATHGRTIKSPVHFRLYEIGDHQTARSLAESKGRLVSETVATEGGLGNNEWFCLESPPINDSQGKTFALEIESPGAAEEESIAPWALRSSPYPLIGLFHAGRRLEHSAICLRTTCSGPI